MEDDLMSYDTLTFSYAKYYKLLGNQDPVEV